MSFNSVWKYRFPWLCSLKTSSLSLKVDFNTTVADVNAKHVQVIMFICYSLQLMSYIWFSLVSVFSLIVIHVGWCLMFFTDALHNLTNVLFFFYRCHVLTLMCIFFWYHVLLTFICCISHVLMSCISSWCLVFFSFLRWFVILYWCLL